MTHLFSRLFRRVKVKNTRRFKRLRSDFLVKYYVNRKGEAYITNARDISAGGIRFWSASEIPKSASLDVSIYLPFLDRTVDALAQVRRVSRVRQGFLFNVAVSFLDLKQEDREAINHFAEDLSQDQKARFLIDHADIVIRKR